MRIRLAWVLPLFCLVVGCSPSIGSKCTLSTDCSQLGDRLCDATQPEGYCTIFNCEPDNCPDSICVAFDFNLDPACGIVDDGRWPRFERTFCMKPCEDDSDCRDYYECVDLETPEQQNVRRAQVVDVSIERLGNKVCMVKAPVQVPIDAGAPPGVCGSTDSTASPLNDGGAGGAGP